MRICLLAVAFLLLVPACSSAETPRLFREQTFNAATLAEAVNYYVGLGEVKAFEELNTLSPSDVPDYNHEPCVAQRVGWVCRILWEPRGKTPLRQPMYGGQNLPWKSFSLAAWPLYPIVRSNSSYFVLSESLILTGHPESPKRYLLYCVKNGSFREHPVLVPSREQALKDAVALHISRSWKAIKWKDSGPSVRYTFSEPWIWKFIQEQAETIPVSASH